MRTTRFVVRNVGGRGRVDLPPGVTVPTGENATNRTSFLQAVMAAMGRDRATLEGLVFALAGRPVHDLHGTVPLVVLDSLEAIDSDRIAAPVE